MTGRGTVESTAGTLGVYVAISIQSVKGDHAWDSEEIKDSGGFDAAWLARNQHITVVATAKLTGTSKAVAKANGAFLLPFAQVTLSDFDLPWLNTTGIAPTGSALTGGATIFSGSWAYYKGGSIDLSNDKAGGMEINLRKYANPAQNTAQHTAAT